MFGKYGATPFFFLLKGKNYYRERKKWVEENKMISEERKEINKKDAEINISLRDYEQQQNCSVAYGSA